MGGVVIFGPGGRLEPDGGWLELDGGVEGWLAGGDELDELGGVGGVLALGQPLRIKLASTIVTSRLSCRMFKYCR